MRARFLINFVLKKDLNFVFTSFLLRCPVDRVVNNK